MDSLKLLISPTQSIHAVNAHNSIDSTEIIKATYGIYYQFENDGSEAHTSSYNVSFLNDTTLFNGTMYINESFTPFITLDNTEENLEFITKNSTNEDYAEIVIAVFTSIILGLMILVTVIGNVFVIAAIFLERNLQTVANYLVASLAVADLLVAMLVMPMGAVYVMSRGWILGPELCDIWTSCDVLCCTASILHLVAIAADRYWAVTDIDYIHSRKPSRIFLMISLIWLSSIFVSLAPHIFCWKDPEYLLRISQQKCMVSQDLAYQIFATCSTFYVPLLVILFLYWKIYQTARKRIHRRRPKQILRQNLQAPSPVHKRKRPFPVCIISKKNKKPQVPTMGIVEGYSTITDDSSSDRRGFDPNPASYCNTTTEGATTSSCDLISTVSQQVTLQTTNEVNENESETDDMKQPSMQKILNSTLTPPTLLALQSNYKLDNPKMQKDNQIPHLQPPREKECSIPQILFKVRQSKSKKDSMETKRERKAAKTLAIITGAFVVCWLPFFVMALLLPLCGDYYCRIDDDFISLFLWLGYFNSTLNPVIYTIFSPEFRQIFKRILCGSPMRNLHYSHGIKT